MDTIELAERTSRAWALMLYLMGAMLLLSELCGMILLRRDFVDGFWLGVALVCALTLLPWRRWLKPNSALNKVLEDEVVREHRRMSCTAGFWASLVAALVTAPFAHDAMIGGYDVARIVATAGLFAAMISFATLELRAAR
ncbi:MULTISPECIES: hypothetical protein [unclassified Sphingomonas]|uniref:hypothetical protein n=1 Tax=unclassified Sphingomonas TaxID=196159 RepID=UPI0004493AF9|nr:MULTISPECIES: hypothetical protein [unclassified Sphingomonas]EZP49314.1 putative membrane protein [Sphingomonas sp. RIT328]